MTAGSGSSTPSLLPQGGAPPLYAFSLPQEILQLLALRSPLGGHAAVTSAGGKAPQSQQQEGQDEREGQEQQSTDGTESSEAAGLGCSLCRSNRFEGIQDQRHHFSSDWHRYNVKRRLAGKPAVNEEEWEGMVEGLSDSLTGSASSSSDEESSSSDRDETLINRVLAKQKISTDAAGTVEDEQPDFASPRSPLLWFETPQDVLKDTQLGIYRAIFPSALKKAHSTATSPWLDELRELQVNEDSSRLGKKSLSRSAAPPTDPASRTWAMFAMGGGHFAGAIFSLVPRLNNQGHNRITREVVCLQSKTFHRYTTRRKQGGSQAANDNAKGNAKSVGAQLRRANEAALVDDIRGLLESWKEQIASSEIVWLRASKTNHRVFYDYEEAVLQKKDPRIRGFPFPTRRPTQAELVRCFDELTRVKLSHLTAEELAELDEAYRAAMMPKKPTLQASKEPAKPAAPEVPKLSKEEVLERDRWERLVDMVRRGRLEPLKGFLEKQAQEIGGSSERASKKWLGALPSWMADERRQSPTVLHVAASSDQPDVVRWLLVEQRADPTLSFLSVDTASSSTPNNGSDGVNGGAIASSTQAPLSQRTAYECASSRGVRNVFRRAYADYPDLWDWQGGARVPSQLTEEMESTQSAKTNVRKSALKQKMRERQSEREAERAVQEAEEEKQRLVQEAEEKRKRAEQSTSGPQRLGGAAPRKVQQMTELKGLTEEQQRRIERERRAKAAEARMAALSG